MKVYIVDSIDSELGKHNVHGVFKDQEFASKIHKQITDIYLDEHLYGTTVRIKEYEVIE